MDLIVIFLKSDSKSWSVESGYQRGVLFPYGNSLRPDVQFQVTKIAPGDHVSRHYHIRQTEFIFFLEGVCDFFFDNRTIRVRKGDLLIIEPGEIHATTNISEVTANFATFKINGSSKDTKWIDK